MKAYYLSLIASIIFAADQRNRVLAIPTPQVFAPFTVSWATTTLPAVNPINSGAPGRQYSLRPASEIFYAITRGENDPPPAFATSAYVDFSQFAPAISDNPGEASDTPESVPHPNEDYPLPELTPIPMIMPTLTSTGAHPSPSRFVFSITRQPSTTRRNTPVATTTIPTSALSPDDDKGDSPERGSKKPQKRSVFVIITVVVGALAAISLCAFLILDPCVSCGCLKQRAKSKGLGKRPISSWFPFPSSPPPSLTVPTRKEVTRRGLELETSENGTGSLSGAWPRSKFSISSSDYSQTSRNSSSTTDTMLVENTGANRGSRPTLMSPIRPPRPPTADSPATISDSVYFAPENQIYMEPLYTHIERSIDDEVLRMYGASSMSTVVEGLGSSPLLPPNMFFTMSSIASSMSSKSTIRQFPDAAGDPFRSFEYGSRLAIREESRHSRTHSAPIFIGNPVDESYQPIYMDPVAKRVLQHRRSRSNSGWAYPKRDRSTSEEDESYHGVFGQAF